MVITLEPSGTYYQDGKKELAFTAMNTEDLTYPVALALLNGRKFEPEEYPSMNDDIHDKIHELKEKFTEEKLLKMRDGLENSYQEFSRIFNIAEILEHGASLPGFQRETLSSLLKQEDGEEKALESAKKSPLSNRSFVDSLEARGHKDNTEGRGK